MNIFVGQVRRGGGRLAQLCEYSQAWSVRAGYEQSAAFCPAPPSPLGPPQRWRDRDFAKRHFVEFNGQPVKSVKTAFQTAVAFSKLPGKVSPHTLRYTAATWLMQVAVSTWEAVGFLGMSEKTLRDVYGHHPNYLASCGECNCGTKAGFIGLPAQASKLVVVLVGAQRAAVSDTCIN